MRAQAQSQILVLVALALWTHIQASTSAASPSQCEAQTSGWYGIGRQWEDMQGTQGDAWSTPWGARAGFGVAVIGGRLAVFGGQDSQAHLKNDVFVSTDARTWTPLHTESAWSPRTKFQNVVHDNFLYVMSGRGCEETGTGYCDDIYRAPAPGQDDAIYQLNFEFVGIMAHSGRERGLALSFQGRIYDIGGCSGSGCFTEINMLDGKIWRRVEVVESTCNREGGCFWTENYVGAWPNTQEYRLVGTAHQNAIYIFGGDIICTVLKLQPTSTGNISDDPEILLATSLCVLTFGCGCGCGCGQGLGNWNCSS
jgi:hypothetical protein